MLVEVGVFRLQLREPGTQGNVFSPRFLWQSLVLARAEVTRGAPESHAAGAMGGLCLVKPEHLLPPDGEGT